MCVIKCGVRTENKSNLNFEMTIQLGFQCCLRCATMVVRHLNTKQRAVIIMKSARRVPMGLKSARIANESHLGVMDLALRVRKSRQSTLIVAFNESILVIHILKENNALWKLTMYLKSVQHHVPPQPIPQQPLTLQVSFKFRKKCLKFQF